MSKIETTQLTQDLSICRIINGMWQVSGGHGEIDHDSAINQMLEHNENGFNSWDMADIYGPAESIYGNFRTKLGKRKGKKELGKIQGFTKFVPNPGPMNNGIVTHHIEESLKKMNVNCIDLLQFHWWDYQNSNYLDALEHLSKLQNKGKIKYLGLTNFDTERIKIIIKNNFKIISNQVQFSILDQRPEKIMIPFFVKHGIKILSYGTLLGGFFSEKYLNVDEPTRADLTTASLQKYKNMIDIWGGWQLFQELLEVLNTISKKHYCSIANIATRFILDKPQVAAVIIGARLGISDHKEDNSKVFDLKLDQDDISLISTITSKSNDLFETIGDCGDEYR